MKWYLVIKTDVGTLDLGLFGNYYRTKKAAEEDARRALTVNGVVSVEVKHL